MTFALGDRRRRLYVYFYVDEPIPEIEARVVAVAQSCAVVGYVQKIAETSYEVIAEGRHDNLARLLESLTLLPVLHRPVIQDVAWLAPLEAHRRLFVLAPGEYS